MFNVSVFLNERKFGGYGYTDTEFKLTAECRKINIPDHEGISIITISTEYFNSPSQRSGEIKMTPDVAKWLGEQLINFSNMHFESFTIEKTF